MRTIYYLNLSHAALIELRKRHDDVLWQYQEKTEDFRVELTPQLWSSLVAQRNAGESDSTLVRRLLA